MPRRPSTAVIVCVAAVAVLLCGTHSAAGFSCGNGEACFPWVPTGPACRAGKQMNLRFVLDVASENYETSGTTTITTATYGFCPSVDKLQSFTLNAAPFVTAAYVTKNDDDTQELHLTKDLDTHYLYVYGFGDTSDRLYPNVNTSSGIIIIAQNGTEHCQNKDSVLVATTLGLDIGLYNGLFNYIDAEGERTVQVPNPDYNQTMCDDIKNGTVTTEAPGSSSSSDEVDYCSPTISSVVPANVVQPAKTGFVPTCTEKDVCMFDVDAHCIGNVKGQKNCARCFDDPTQLASAQMQIWASYYGTDVDGHPLLSGGTNPINFRKFAGKSMFSQIGSKVGSLWRGNLSDLGLGLNDW